MYVTENGVDVGGGGGGEEDDGGTADGQGGGEKSCETSHVGDGAVCEIPAVRGPSVVLQEIRFDKRDRVVVVNECVMAR